MFARAGWRDEFGLATYVSGPVDVLDERNSVIVQSLLWER